MGNSRIIYFYFCTFKIFVYFILFSYRYIINICVTERNIRYTINIKPPDVDGKFHYLLTLLDTIVIG